MSPPLSKRLTPWARSCLASGAMCTLCTGLAVIQGSPLVNRGSVAVSDGSSYGEYKGVPREC